MEAKISVTVLTKNSQKYLPEVLAALTAFDEVIICDTGSSDLTMEIARQYSNVTLHQRPFIGFGPTHNVATDLARNDWILSVDSDEVVTPELADEIQALTLLRGSVYTIPRLNEYKGKWIKWCGWYPDRQVRLYHRRDTRFTDAQVHEGVITDKLQKRELKAALRHYSYTQVGDFLAKMQSYSDLFAAQHQGKKSSSMAKAVVHGLAAFFKSYVIKRGFLGGAEGFEISVYNANTAFYKYLKLAEFNHRLKLEKDADGRMKKPVSSK